MRIRRVFPLLLATFVLAPAVPAAAQELTQLVVVEVATVRAVPDTATVAAEITRRARSAAAARRRVERRVAAVLSKLDTLGVPRAEVRTRAVNSFRTRRRGRVRHHASTSLEVRTTDLAKLSQILGAFGGASISGPEFEVSDTTAARQEATTIALQRARARAEAAAAALGLRIVAIRKVDLNAEFGYDAAPEPAAGGGTNDSAGSGGGVSIEPGREQVAVAVAVVYEIGP
jgi:uncharacterized protein